jgi:hypothetical protein
MRTEGLFRLVELARREIGAEDARVELGGREPDDPRVVWCPIGDGWRLVVVFKDPPEDVEQIGIRLQALATAFAGLTSDARNPSDPPSLREPLQRRIDVELEALALRAEALAAIVVDEKSPVVWGLSVARAASEDVTTLTETAALSDELSTRGLDLAVLLASNDASLQLARAGLRASDAQRFSGRIDRLRDYGVGVGVEPDEAAWQRHVRIARAVALVRGETTKPDFSSGHLRLALHGESLGVWARSFATIYALVLVYGQPFSELHAEGAAVHALPLIERLVLALPPIDPSPGKADVIRLKKR